MSDLYVSFSFPQKVLALPLLTRRVLRALMDTLMDPDQVRLNYYLMRIFAVSFLKSKSGIFQ